MTTEPCNHATKHAIDPARFRMVDGPFLPERIPEQNLHAGFVLLRDPAHGHELLEHHGPTRPCLGLRDGVFFLGRRAGVDSAPLELLLLKFLLELFCPLPC